MNVRRCPNCDQSLPADSILCVICDETTFTAQTQEKLTHSASLNTPRALNLRYQPLSDSTGRTWARPARLATSTLEPEDKYRTPAHIPWPKQNQPLFRSPWHKPGYPANYHFPPKLLFWIFSLILLVLVAGGTFGIAATLGHGNASGAVQASLQITPASAVRGALISLRGSHFNPGDLISLTRDINIPLSDTAGKSLIKADSQGNFSDTALIDTNWSAGTHSIHAEDARLHKIASFPLKLDGRGLSQRPPHLLLSASTLDLGTGDPATNSTKIVILSNAGGGNISWEAHADQPWLQFSPPGSHFSSTNNPDVGLVIAADRTGLTPGAYHATLTIMSNAGEATISVKMGVKPFNPGNGAIFQVSPPVMSFTAQPAGSAPATQALQIANPGNGDLQWTLAMVTDNAGSWLTSSSNSGQVVAGGAQQVLLGIKPGHLPLGTYKGHITLNATGPSPVQDSSQTIVVTLTIQPQCNIQVSASSLSFNVGDKQPMSTSQQLAITNASSCKTSSLWTASASTQSGGGWLTLSSKMGTTPANTNVIVNGAGLDAGTYTGSLKLSNNNNDSVSIAVALLVMSSPGGGKPPQPARLVFSPTSLAFTGNPDQGSLAAQTFTLTNSGGIGLNWHASSTVAWLQPGSSTGSLSPNKSQQVSVTASTTGLASGDQSGAIILSATDSNGKTLTGGQINVVLHIQAPCTLIVGSNSLNFSATSGQPNPGAQTVSLTAGSTCSQNVQWNASSPDSWVTITPTQGSIAGGAGGSININMDITTLVAGSYTSQITLTATDSANGQSLGNIPPISINLQVQAASVSVTSTPTPAANQTPAIFMLSDRKDIIQEF